jgi:predicted nucleic acid-binding Zn ribbon protein
MDLSNNNPTEHIKPTSSCPICAETIQANALKCKHCGEFLSGRPKKAARLTKAIASFGALTALLSLFYALREGDFYIEKQQQARTEINSYLKVADEFEKLGTLLYAEHAIAQALKLSPNDIYLQQKYFLLQSKWLLDDMEWRPISASPDGQIGRLIIDGYRLKLTAEDKKTRINILQNLARLVTLDSQWQGRENTASLFEHAMKLDRRNAETLFRYGQWLVTSNFDRSRGLQLIEAATQLAPLDALYQYQFGDFYLKEDDFEQSLPLLMSAANLLEQQSQLIRVQAANFAKASLKRLLIESELVFDFIDGEFLRLDAKDTLQFLKTIVNHSPNDRNVNFVMAKYFYSVRDYQQASIYLNKVFSINDLAKPLYSSNYRHAELLRDILKETKESPTVQQTLAEEINNYWRQNDIAESMLWRKSESEFYRVGLRVRSRTDTLTVIRAYTNYPFAKSGLRADDRLLTINGNPLKSLEDLHNIIGSVDIGNTLPISWQRNGQLVLGTLIVE